MKKLIVLFFALLFFVSSAFPSKSYRRWAYWEVDGVWEYLCFDDGGTCLPTVIVEEPAP